MGEIILRGYLCERCKHKWPPRNSSNQKPFVCPKCKTPYWNIPKKNNSERNFTKNKNSLKKTSRKFRQAFIQKIGRASCRERV